MISHNRFRDKIAAAEKEAIIESLEQNERHPIRTAVALGIHPVTLYRKMKIHGMTF